MSISCLKPLINFLLLLRETPKSITWLLKVLILVFLMYFPGPALSYSSSVQILSGQLACTMPLPTSGPCTWCFFSAESSKLHTWVDIYFRFSFNQYFLEKACITARSRLVFPIINSYSTLSLFFIANLSSSWLVFQATHITFLRVTVAWKEVPAAHQAAFLLRGQWPTGRTGSNCPDNFRPLLALGEPGFLLRWLLTGFRVMCLQSQSR